MRRRGIAILVLIAALSACGGPRVAPTRRSDALADARPREMRVIKVWDQLTDGTDESRDENVSHVIEVEVLSGEEQGKVMALPYDEWNVGRRPPAAGERVMSSPADWVRRNPDSRGRPFGGWR